jgi:hypothetical protein
MKKTALFASLAIALLAASIGLPAAQGTLPSAQAQEKSVELTVYNQDLALVRENRQVTLDRGHNEVVYSDVAALMDPTSVAFKSLSDPENTVVLEQNFEYDLVGSSALLEKYIDQQIVVQAQDGTTYSGTLLSGAGDVILQTEDGSVVVLKYDQISTYSFPALPEGLRTRPSLVWLIGADKSGPHDTEVTYLTNGINWRADYVLQLNQDETLFDLDGWVTLDNRSGATYEEATLKLVAGDINVVQEQVFARAMAEEAFEMPAAAPAVEEREFFEYHLYQVTRPVTVKDNQTKQVEFTNASSVPVTKFFVYDGGSPRFYPGARYQDAGYGAFGGDRDVTVMLEFRTDAESGLETQLPAGRVRMYQEDVDGSPLLVGEDQIDHTPKDETVRLTVGTAFDVVGERVQTDYRSLGRDSAEESYRITLRNHKAEDIEVRVVERMFRGSDWEITDEQLDGQPASHKELDSNTVEWLVPVPADGDVELTYTVRYVWR